MGKGREGWLLDTQTRVHLKDTTLSFDSHDNDKSRWATGCLQALLPESLVSRWQGQALEVSLASTQPVSSVFRLPSFSLGFAANQRADPQCMPILPVVVSPPTAASHQGTAPTPSASIQGGFRKPGGLLSPAELRNFKRHHREAEGCAWYGVASKRRFKDHRSVHSGLSSS